MAETLKKIFGIDLGTTYSCIAHVDETGTPVVLRNAENEAVTPSVVFFDGDKLRHRITPLSDREIRVSLTFEYVTDRGMRPWWRFISNIKDAIGYFGFRQVMRGRKGKA